jgi:hypothetical protein
MCDFTNGIKLCSCNGDIIKFRVREFYHKIKGELFRIPNKQNESIPLIYIWQLFRYVGKEETYSLGKYIFPTDDIGNGLNAEWILLNLNVENCFDFEYIPYEGDNLFISQNVELSKYISFIFQNGEWIIEHYDPFSDITEFILEGRVIEVAKKNGT